MQVAQWEREVISERTLAGLDRAKAHGVRLGRRSLVSPDLRAYIRQLRPTITLHQIADRLNADGTPGPDGKGKWHPTGVGRQLASH